jgi:hypothetical protein
VFKGFQKNLEALGHLNERLEAVEAPEVAWCEFYWKEIYARSATCAGRACSVLDAAMLDAQRNMPLERGNICGNEQV